MYSHPLCSSQTEVLHSLYSNPAVEFHLLGFAEVSLWQRISVWQTKGRLIWPTFFCLSFHRQMFIPFSVLDSGIGDVVCAFCPYMTLRSTSPDGRLRLIDWPNWTICHGPGRGEKDRFGEEGGMHFDGVPLKKTTRRERVGLAVTGSWHKVMSCQSSFVFPH